MGGLRSQLCCLPHHLKHTAALSVCALEKEVVVTVDGSDMEGRGGTGERLALGIPKGICYS